MAAEHNSKQQIANIGPSSFDQLRAFPQFEPMKHYFFNFFNVHIHITYLVGIKLFTQPNLDSSMSSFLYFIKKSIVSIDHKISRFRYKNICPMYKNSETFYISIGNFKMFKLIDSV